MAHQHARAASIENRSDGREGGHDPTVVGDPPVGERHVEVDADEHGASGDVHGVDGRSGSGGQWRLRSRRCEGHATGRRADADDIDDGGSGRYRRFA